MKVDFQEQTINYLRQTLPDAVYQEEVTEFQLPESMQEIEQIISCGGCIYMHHKECSGGKVTVSGQIKACVLYRASDDNDLHVAEKELDFTVRKEVPAEHADPSVFYSGWLKRIDARLLNSRRVLIRANIGSRFAFYAPSSVCINTPINTPKSLQVQSNSYDMMLPAFLGESEFRINEESTLPETTSGISKILRSSVNYRISESKPVGDKAIFKGDLLIHVLYASSTGSLHCFDTEVPFSQYTELNGETECGTVHVMLQPMSAEIDTDGQEDSKRLLISVSAFAQAVVYDKMKVAVIEDAYVTRGELDAQWQDVFLPASLDSQQFTASGEASVAASADKVIDAAVYADCPIVRRDRDRVKTVMPVFANVVYIDREGKLQGREMKHEICCDTVCASDAHCCAAGDIFEQPVCLASYDTVTLRMTAQMQLESSMGSKLHALHSAQIDTQKDQDAGRPSLIARKAGTESVWEIAKSCRTTVDAICEANGLSGGAVTEGTILLIPIQ